MGKLKTLPLAAFVLLLLLCSTAWSGSLIRLQAIAFDPSKAPAEVSAPSGSPYQIIQCAGPIQPEWTKAIQATGATILGYLPDFAYLVRVRSGQEGALRTLPFAGWMGSYLPSYKFDPRLPTEATGTTGELTVVLFPGESLSAARPAIKLAGAKILAESPDSEQPIFRVEAPIAALPALARITAVQWIEEYVHRELHNDAGRAIMNVGSAWTDVGLYGSGQIVAVCDTGLDTGNVSTLSADFAGRLIAGHAWGRTGNWADGGTGSGHGTHVSGSVLGNGTLSGSDPTTHNYATSFAGVAPEARLVMQSVLDSSGGLGGLPADLNALFQEAYTDGARIHTNSWGANVFGRYTLDSRNTDLFMWNHPDTLILFSAGNSGADANRDGVIDADSIGAPGTAKNCLTVGATENLRATNVLTWNAAWPATFPTAPVAGDKVSDNAWGMAAFSSRGPTDDGRIKPEICAPGTNVVSCQSHAPGTGSVNGVYNANYCYGIGTSMSTPLTAGAVALVRQYFLTKLVWPSVSAAMLKATLINGAADMTPGQYGPGATQEISGRPDHSQGWGRVDLAATLGPGTQTRDYKDNTAGIGTGQSVSYPYSVPRGSALRVILAYTDYPALLGSRVQLVNDLDLVVTAPNGTRFYPNRLSGPDRLNPVEDVQIDGADTEAGVYTVTVSGYNVPNGPQPYALVTRVIPGVPDLSASAVAVSQPGTVHTGQTLTYTITVRNPYGMPATNVLVTNPIPAGASYVASSTRLNGAPVVDNGPMISGLPVNSPGSSAGVVTSALPAVVTFQVVVNSGLAEGAVLTDTATITGANGISLTRSVASSVHASKIIRVKVGGTGDGSSWPNAMASVVSAVNASAAGDEIWVAAGAYTGNIVMKDDIALYGGFAGTETSRDTRNWQTNITTLDGNKTGSVISFSYLPGSQMRVDGFTIRNGSSSSGGGISCIYASPTIANNVITANVDTNSTYGGGGLYLRRYFGTVTNNEISNNTAGRGGGICCSLGAPRILGNSIRANTTTGTSGYGAGIVLDNSLAVIANNQIIGNTLAKYGGGIGVASLSGSPIATNTQPLIANNTFSGNTSTATNGGSAIYVSSGFSPTIANNIIAQNSSGIYGAVGLDVVTIRNNCVFSNGNLNYSGISAGPGDISANPQFVDYVNGDFHLLSTSPCIDRGDDATVQADWLDGDMQTRIVGQHVDMGADEFGSAANKLASPVFQPDGGACVGPVNVTIRGIVSDATIHFTTNGANPTEADPVALPNAPIPVTGFPFTIKAGAWKTGSAPSDVKAATYTFGAAARIYVSGGPGGATHDGVSWATAFQTVQAGINAAQVGDEVWVADGLYVGSISLKPGVALYGGFSGAESAREQRNWVANRTILDGRKAASVVTIPAGTDSATRIDGFVIQNGSASYGGGINCAFSSATIANNTLTGNWASTDGGAIYCYRASPTIANNVIAGNGAYTSAGGILANLSAPTIVNNTIVANSAANPGSAIYCYSSSAPTVVNNIIAFNASGFYNDGSSEGVTVLRNNCFYGNNGADYTGVADRTGREGNIAGDPKIAALPYGGMHIQPDSPCRDAGDSSVVPTGATDFSGSARILGTAVDIGADESNGAVWSVLPPRIARVAPGGSNSSDGSTWALAMSTIQAACDAVAAGGGGEVWLAQGSYNQRFTLRPYVHVYGGFNGESDRAARDWVNHVTTVNGQAGGAVVIGDRPGYLVSTLDGCTIRGGSSSGISLSGSSPLISNDVITANTTGGGGGGVICSSGSAAMIAGCLISGNSCSQTGGGILCTANSAATVANSTITGNSANFGGGIGCAGNSPATITRNLIQSNSAGNDGGGVFSSSSSPSIRANRIIGNSAAGTSGNGGGIRCEANTAYPVIDSNAIAGNSAVNGGGVSLGANGSPGVTCNTIVGNNAYGGGGGVDCQSGVYASLLSNLVAYNSSGIRRGGTSGSVSLTRNCVYQNAGLDYSGLTAGSGDFSNKDPRLVDPAHGDFHLQPDSPCRGAGDFTWEDPAWTDLDGQPRLQGASVDIGADQSDGTLWAVSPRVVRVKSGGDNLKDGTAWSQAKGSVQAGIDAVSAAGGGEVWIAGGVYNERVTLPALVHLYGGFVGNEVGRAQRNWVQNPTILDGQAGGTVVRPLGGYLASTISGLTIRNGLASFGAGLYCKNVSPIVANNLITGNSSTGSPSYAGGAYFYQSFAPVINNVFAGNNAPTRGGGLYGMNCAQLIANNTFVNNTSASGGAIQCDTSTQTIANNLVAFNSSGIQGSSADMLHSNCVYSNGAQNYAGGVAPGAGDFSDKDPLLVNWQAGDYHLQAFSPCIDAGQDVVVMPDWVDLDGQPRIFGAHVDVGADEVTPQQGFSSTGGLVKRGRWNLVSVPADPVNPDPVSVFAGIDVPNASFLFWKNDVSGGGFQVYGDTFGWKGPIVRGIPYWFLETGAGPDKEVSYAGIPPTGDYSLALPARSTAPYWIAFGTPFPTEVPCGSLAFRNTSVTSQLQSWTQAYDLGMVESLALGYDSATSTFFTAGPDASMPLRNVLQPWKGYWLLVKRPEATTITFPKP